MSLRKERRALFKILSKILHIILNRSETHGSVVGSSSWLVVAYHLRVNVIRVESSLCTTGIENCGTGITTVGTGIVGVGLA